MKKIFLPVAFIFLLLTQTVLAATFTTEATPATTYLAGRDAIINLTITNNGPTEWFSISTIGLPSDWLRIDTSSGLLKVDSGKSETIKVFVSPGKDAIPLTYEYFITVKRTSDNEVVEKRVLVSVKQITDVILSDLKLSCEQCSKAVEITGSIYNIGTRDIPVTLEISFGDDIRTVSLDQLRIMEEETFSELFTLTDLDPASYSIGAKVTTGEKTLYEDTKNFEIAKVKNITFENKSFTTPFGRFVSIKAINNGNYKTDVEFKSIVNSAWYISYAGPEPTSKEGVYTWIVYMEPAGKYELGYSEIYWPTYLIVLIIIILGFMMYLNYTAVSVSKAITGPNVVEMGHELSVTINIKNKIRNIDNMIVKDVIPEGFMLISKFDTVKPTLRKTSEGTELVWKIGEFKPHEHRVLHYKMKPIKAFRGTKHLAKANLIAKYGEKFIKRSSNLVSIYSSGNQPSILPVSINK